MLRRFSVLALVCAGANAQWVDLFNKKDLTGWEVIGNSVWTAWKDGTLVGERDLRPVLHEAPFLSGGVSYRSWINTQSWLYTRRNDFPQFDLSLEYWVRAGGNSGISIRDTSRAQWAVTTPADFKRTPSKIGYEIQINNGYPDKFPTGSIYTFVSAKTGVQVDNQWNRLEIESRDDLIRVKLNGVVVAEHPGDPQRSKTGPIGLQLHDQFSTAMFRNIRIREIK